MLLSRIPPRIRRCAMRRSWPTASASCSTAPMSEVQKNAAHENILFDTGGGIARLTLNRPAKLNSFTAAMHTEIRVVLESLARDKAIRVLVLTGAGRAFCVGPDLC